MEDELAAPTCRQLATQMGEFPGLFGVHDVYDAIMAEFGTPTVKRVVQAILDAAEECGAMVYADEAGISRVVLDDNVITIEPVSRGTTTHA